jgi:hypothetical protein
MKTTTRMRPLTPQLSNIVPPDHGARHGWVLLAAGLSPRQRERIKLTLTLDHVTAGAGMEVRGVG